MSNLELQRAVARSKRCLTQCGTVIEKRLAGVRVWVGDFPASLVALATHNGNLQRKVSPSRRNLIK